MLNIICHSVQSLSCVWLFATPWTAACQASLSITNCGSLPKHMSIESVMPSNHLIICHPLLLLPSIFPFPLRVFSNESALRIRWPKYWSFSFNISLPMNTQDRSPLGWIGWISLQSKGLSCVIRETKIKTMRHHCTPISTAQFQNITTSAANECAEKQDLSLIDENTKLHQLWRTACQFLTKLNIVSPYNPEIVPLVIY